MVIRPDTAQNAAMNWRLLFSGTQPVGWMLAVVLAIAATIGLCLWLLKYERQLVSIGVGRSLLTLRLLVLVLLLVTLMQPVLTKSWDISRRGRAVIAIDVSDSMETLDRHALPAEKLRWAQALGMLGSEQTNDLLDQWAADFDAGREPNWLGSEQTANSPADPETAEARRRQVATVFDEIDHMPRLEFVRRLMQSPPRNLLKQLSEVIPLDLRLFASEEQKIEPAQLQQKLDKSRDELQPGGTNIFRFLAGLTAEPDSSQLRGVVLITDGRQTSGADVVSEARRLGSLGVPVFTVPIGSRMPPRDLSIVSVESPESVYVNDAAQILATIGTSGFEGQDLIIRLEKDGAVIDQQTVTPASDSAVVRFTVPTQEVGRFEYRVAAPTQPGEIRSDNNAQDLSLQVVDSKARVLLAEGDARWEFRYLKNLLERDQQTELNTVLFRQPWAQILNETFISRTLPPNDQLKDVLAKTDILMIGDVPPEQLTEDVWAIIEQAVQNDGLTLMIIPGRRNMPQAYRSRILSELLPVENFRQLLAEQFRPSLPDEDQTAFQLLPSSDAAVLPMFQSAAEPGQAFDPSARPGHPWAYAVTPRASATVWADAVLPGNSPVREPIIVHQYYGFGQVVWMGIDSTWRWRRRVGDRLHHQFWGQLVRWAARNKSAAGNDQVRLTLSDAVIDETESVEVNARWIEQVLPQLAGATVEAVLTRTDNDSATASKTDSTTKALPAPTAPPTAQNSSAESGVAVVLQPAAENPERYFGRLPKLQPGSWNVRLRVTDGQLKLNSDVSTDLLVRPRLTDELANINCSRELLQQVASLSGGQMVEPFAADTLQQLITPQEQTDSKLEERTLWDHWVTLLLFFALLTTEWVIRKLNGLP